MLLNDCNCSVEHWTTESVLTGNDFGTGKRVRLCERRSAIRPGNTTVSDDTFGRVPGATWTVELDNEEPIPSTGDIFVVKRFYYGNDPLRTLEGKALEVQDVIARITGITCTCIERNESL